VSNPAFSNLVLLKHIFVFEREASDSVGWSVLAVAAFNGK